MARSTNGNIAKVGLYRDDIDTAAANKVGREELTNREAFNAVCDILNNEWSTWTPTVAYTGTGPSEVGAASTGATVARYKQLGSTVHFQYQYVVGAQSGIAVTNATITLPINPKDTDTYPVMNAIALGSSNNYYDPVAYIDQTTGTAASRFIRFRSFQALIATNPYAMYVNGTYEVT